MATRVVLFRVAAGPRIGFGHLLRCRALATALRWRHEMSVRGPKAAKSTAARLGCRVVTGSARRLIEQGRISLLVIDDPVAAAAQSWAEAATRKGIPVASLHDLGIAPIRSDLGVDGSIAPGRLPGAATRLSGPRFAVLHPKFAKARQRGRAPVRASGRRVLIALGGGSRQRLATELARAIRLARPDLDVRVAGGFSSRRRASHKGPARWLTSRPTLAAELMRADLAVVGGGMTLYEACCLGVPAFAVPVVAAQRPAVRAFIARGCAASLGPSASVARAISPKRKLAAAAGRISRLASDKGRRAGLATAARRLVDGRGADRVAKALRAMVRKQALVQEAP